MVALLGIVLAILLRATHATSDVAAVAVGNTTAASQAYTSILVITVLAVVNLLLHT